MSNEMENFQADLLASVRDMKAGRAARSTQVELTKAAAVRSKLGLSQSAFSRLLGVSTRTVQDWEQGRREPNGAAQTLLGVAAEYPDVLRAYIAAHPNHAS
jgi:putative transcriptional regulator